MTSADTNSTDSRIVEIVYKYWGFKSLRPQQQEAVNAVLGGNDTIVLLPTGGGKSLCFQIPALVNPGICIVISPLIALIKDQVEGLRRKGIKAIGLAGYQTFYDLDTALENCIYGDYKFLYLSPERLEQNLVIERLKKMPVNLIAIDEAHCISQWGQDFRPSYRKINALNALFPQVPKIALTASATPRVFNDILANLEFTCPTIVRQSFARKNIGYHICHSEDKIYTTQLLLAQNKGTSIVYTTNRKFTEDVSTLLNKKGIASTFFHGGLDTHEKENRLNQWLNNEVRVMVATNAFGMGIDKPDVRSVIHLNIPESIESYYQETGRAGRDGNPSQAFLITNAYDTEQVRNQFLKNLANVDQIKLIYKNLNSYMGIAYGELQEAPYILNFGDFCSRYGMPSLLVYNGLKTLDRLGVLTFSQNFQSQTLLLFTTTSQELLRYIDKTPLVKRIVHHILRLYGGIFERPTAINLEVVCKGTQAQIREVLNVLEQLHNEGFAEYKAQHNDTEIIFLVPREDDRTINTISKKISTEINIKTQRVESILEYVKNTNRCKSLQILEYFGEKSEKPCNICSVCISTRKNITTKDLKGIKDRVYVILKKNPHTSREIALKHEDLKEVDILQALEILLEEGTIDINAKNEYYACNP